MFLKCKNNSIYGEWIFGKEKNDVGKAKCKQANQWVYFHVQANEKCIQFCNFPPKIG